MPGKDYSFAYKEQVYAIWYAGNRLSMPALYDAIPVDDKWGEKPVIDTLETWKVVGSWDQRADETDIEVSRKTDRELISMRMRMMKRHAQMAERVAESAYKHLMDVGFDSSTSAVNALFKAFEEEKRSRGMEVALSQVFSMSDDDLQKTMNRLLAKAKGLGPGDEQPVDTEVVDAISTEERTND